MPSVAALPPLTHSLMAPPELVAKRLEHKATLLRLASKVALAAVFGIMTAALTVALLGASIIPSGFGFPLLGLAFGIPLILRASTALANRSMLLSKQAECERAIAMHPSQKLSHQEVSDWIKRHEITPHPRFSQKGGPDIRRLIARVDYFFEKMQRLKELRDECFACVQPEIGYDIYQKIHFRFEAEALPNFLEAALHLELIANPEQELSLEKLGTCVPQGWGERALFPNYPYFFFSGKDKPPLAIDYLTVDPNLENLNSLRKAIFQKA